MDNLNMLGYSGLRTSTKSEGRVGVSHIKFETAQNLSRLDSARIKLSELTLKYGKQGRQEEIDSPLSLSPKESFQPYSARLVINDDEDVEKSFKVNNNDQSDKTADNSLEDLKDEISRKEFPIVHLSPLQSTLSNQQRIMESYSSMSEVSENVHSFSSLLRSEIKDDSSGATLNEALAPSAQIVSKQETETNESSVVASISSELLSGQEIIQMASLLTPPKVASDELQTTPSSAPSSHSKQEVFSQEMVMIKETEKDQSSVSSKLEKKKETSASSVKYSPSKSSDTISPPTLVSGNRKPMRRNAKAKTKTKRSRPVQVNSSWTESEYERRSCPILRAQSLPPGLRIADDLLDERLDTIDDGVQILLRSQLHLTLSLLQREQALYLNTCSAAARLEKGYRQHTLSDTRKFIRREKGLRGELRRAAKLEKEGTALLRKQ